MKRPLKKTSTTKPQTLDDYIDREPPDVRKLREIRACIRIAAPKAEKGIKWGTPAFSHRRILVMFGAFKQHIGFYPMPAAIRAFAKDLAGFKSAKGWVQFPYTKPLPRELVRKMTALSGQGEHGERRQVDGAKPRPAARRRRRPESCFNLMLKAS